MSVFPLTESQMAVIAQTRFGWGAVPGGISWFSRNTVERLVQQLTHERLEQYDTDGMNTAEVMALTIAASRSLRDQKPDKMKSGRRLRAQIDREEIAFFRDAITTKDAFLHRLYAFWADHFAISSRVGALRAITGPYAREAILPNVLGSFEDMLQAVSHHPAMLRYLDNHISVGPNSKLAKRRDRGRGLNENLAREILELHTLGVDGGYDQSDVLSLAKALTGWRYSRPGRQQGNGNYDFDEERHEPGPKTLLGKVYRQKGKSQGEAMLSDLARHPKTAKHIATKLALHFVSDIPSDALVDSLARTFVATGGNLMEMSKRLVTSEAAWTAARDRFLPPQDFIIAVARAYDGLDPKELPSLAKQMGHGLWRPPSPEGHPDVSDDWLGPEGLKLRLKIAKSVAQRQSTHNSADYLMSLYGGSLSEATLRTVRRAESTEQGTILSIMSPEFLRR